MTQVELVLDCRNTLGEGPMWSVAEQALYWVDILGESVHRLDPATGAHEQHDVGQPVGAILLRAGGGFVLALRDGLYTWQPGDSPQLIIDPEPDKPANRFNDAAVDRQGRIWAGTMADGSEPVGSLYRLDADRSLHIMATDIYVSNGLGWSPDNSIMYYCDSGTGSIRAWDFDAQTGGLSNERPYVSAEPVGGAPDGLTVDSEGCVWSARWGGWESCAPRSAGPRHQRTEGAGFLRQQRDVRWAQSGRAVHHHGAHGHGAAWWRAGAGRQFVPRAAGS